MLKSVFVFFGKETKIHVDVSFRLVRSISWRAGQLICAVQ